MEMTTTGEDIFYRTYSRTKPDGTRETWAETVQRVVDGNLALVSPDRIAASEREELIRLISEFKLIPAGRHLWASGVKGRQYLSNCHVSGWSDNPSDHFRFTFLRLMEGGGVGANYSNRFLDGYADVKGPYTVHIVCDPDHPDYPAMLEAGVLSDTYVGDWAGAYEVEDSREGWADALTDLIGTYYRFALNENRVFDVSRVRRSGARLKSSGGVASGPLPLATMLHEVAGILNGCEDRQLDGMAAMEIDHAIAKCVVAGGNRRSARMALMHWKDPQIAEFLECKAASGSHWTTNISVEVDQEIWYDIEDFQHGRSERPEALRILENIAEGMLHNGEPGIWDYSHANEAEPNEVVACNPCGEIALEAWENCNLGHVNLAAFVDENGEVDLFDVMRAHRLMTRFLIRATNGDVNDGRQADVIARNRRIGVGHLGVASYLAMTGTRYSDAPTSEEFIHFLQQMNCEVQDAAVEYAHELRIPVPVKTTTVAPTGTIAKMPGVSEGIHPIYSQYFLRRIRFSTIDPDQRETALRYAEEGFKVEPCQYAENTVVVEIPTKDSLMAAVEQIHGEEKAQELVQSAADLTLEDMLRFQLAYQAWWANNAVSYTANIDPEVYTAADIASALLTYGPGLKGATVFPELSRPQSPYERITREQYEAYANGEVADGVDENCVSGACPVR